MSSLLKTMPGVLLLVATTGCGPTGEDRAAELDAMVASILIDDYQWELIRGAATVDQDAVRDVCAEQSQAAFAAEQRIADADWPDDAADEVYELGTRLAQYAFSLHWCAKAGTPAEVSDALELAADYHPADELDAAHRALTG